MKKSKNASAELDAIHEREMRDLGIVRVDEPSEVVQAVSQALSGEQPLGDGRAWTVIGGIKMGSESVVKTPLGQPMFTLRIEALPGADFEKGAIHPVLVKRNEDGEIEKLTIDFSKTLEYANLSEKPLSQAETIAAMQALVKTGLLKPKG